MSDPQNVIVTEYENTVTLSPPENGRLICEVRDANGALVREVEGDFGRELVVNRLAGETLSVRVADVEGR